MEDNSTIKYLYVNSLQSPFRSTKLMYSCPILLITQRPSCIPHQCSELSSVRNGMCDKPSLTDPSKQLTTQLGLFNLAWLWLWPPRQLVHPPKAAPHPGVAGPSVLPLEQPDGQAAACTCSLGLRLSHSLSSTAQASLQTHDCDHVTVGCDARPWSSPPRS